MVKLEISNVSRNEEDLNVLELSEVSRLKFIKWEMLLKL